MTLPTRSALDTLWTTQAIVATVLAGEALAVVIALAGPSDDRWVLFGLSSLLVQWTGLSALGAIYLMRKALAGLGTLSLAWVCLGLMVIAAYLVAVVAQAAYTATSSDPPDRTFVSRMLGVAVAVGLLALVAFQNYYESRRAALRAKQAELEALQARVHPHFLFNTLNSAAALVHARPREAEQVLLDMSDLFRAALSQARWVPLSLELDLCRRYLSIEQLRFGERLRVEWDLPPELDDDVQVPLLTLQPLLENAVLHGTHTDGSKLLRIRVALSASTLILEVSNPVYAAGTDQAVHHGHGVGLAGVRARLESLVGSANLLSTQEHDGCFVARLELPRVMMEAAQASTR